MQDVKFLINERIFETYYDLLVYKLSDDSSRKHTIALKDDCIIIANDQLIYVEENDKDIIYSLEIIKARKTYKIDKNVHGVYIYPSSDYKLFFLDKDTPIKSRELGIKHISHIIFLRYYQWNFHYNNKTMDILPLLFSNIEIDDYIIKPNTILTLDDNKNIKFIENVEPTVIMDKFKTSFF